MKLSNAQRNPAKLAATRFLYILPTPANHTHYNVGKVVRQTIKNLGGTMPENLPTPDKSIKKIEHEQEHKLK